MAIHSTYRQTDLEKRLKILRQQVYGKEGRLEVGNEKIDTDVRSEKFHFTSQHPTSHIPHPTSTTQSFRSDITYLHHDLLKISLLASLALGGQIILFIFSKNRILNLNFF